MHWAVPSENRSFRDDGGILDLSCLRWWPLAMTTECVKHGHCN